MLKIVLSLFPALGLVLSAAVPSNVSFPNPSNQQILDIQTQAGGLLPSGPFPKNISDASATALQLIAFNELFEVAYFNSLLGNITNGTTGYTGSNTTASSNSTSLAKIFRTIVAQEELHAIGAISLLKQANRFAPSPCQYQFPVSNLNDSISLAETFTAIVLGALQGANAIFAQDMNLQTVQTVSSIIGQEGEQNGFYRYYMKQQPSEKPFLTFVPAQFAWSALQMFVVPNSCNYSLSTIDLPIFPPLMTNGGPVAALDAKNQTLSFSANLSTSTHINQTTGLYLTYLTGQNSPVSARITNVKWSNSTVSFSAPFPYDAYVMQGLSIGALTTAGNFTNATEMVNATLAAPAVIQAKNPI